MAAGSDGSRSNAVFNNRRERRELPRREASLPPSISSAVERFSRRTDEFQYSRLCWKARRNRLRSYRSCNLSTDNMGLVEPVDIELTSQKNMLATPGWQTFHLCLKFGREDRVPQKCTFWVVLFCSDRSRTRQ